MVYNMAPTICGSIFRSLIIMVNLVIITNALHMQQDTSFKCKPFIFQGGFQQLSVESWSLPSLLGQSQGIEAWKSEFNWLLNKAYLGYSWKRSWSVLVVQVLSRLEDGWLEVVWIGGFLTDVSNVEDWFHLTKCVCSDSSSPTLCRQRGVEDRSFRGLEYSVVWNTDSIRMSSGYEIVEGGVVFVG